MTRSVIHLVLFALAVPLSSCGGPAGPISPESGPRPKATGEETIALQSPAFEPGGAIPSKYTCDGANVSPPLTWSGVPQSARSLALLVEDPDAPGGLFTHWVLYLIPPNTLELVEGEVPAGAVEGTNSFRKPGYGGPCPPKGPAHRYTFRLYALDGTPDLPPGATREQLIRAIPERVLAEGELTGTYARH